MGELSMDNIDRQADTLPPGLLAARASLSEYPAGAIMPAAMFNQITKALEICAGADNCRHCLHQADCAWTYDELSNRVK